MRCIFNVTPRRRTTFPVKVAKIPVSCSPLPGMKSIMLTSTQIIVMYLGIQIIVMYLGIQIIVMYLGTQIIVMYLDSTNNCYVFGYL